jgi:hypothetical protein
MGIVGSFCWMKLSERELASRICILKGVELVAYPTNPINLQGVYRDTLLPIDSKFFIFLSHICLCLYNDALIAPDCWPTVHNGVINNSE